MTDASRMFLSLLISQFLAILRVTIMHDVAILRVTTIHNAYNYDLTLLR